MYAGLIHAARMPHACRTHAARMPHAMQPGLLQLMRVCLTCACSAAVWWSGGDNGPEKNCPPAGRCAGSEHRPLEGPGSAGPLRGRKRDVWEGGHRVPGIISWPAVVHGPARTSWDTVVTMDFLATVMDVLQAPGFYWGEGPGDNEEGAGAGRAGLVGVARGGGLDEISQAEYEIPHTQPQ